MRIFLLLLALATVNVFAQDSEYEFKIKENNLEKEAFDFSLRLNPYFTDISNDNTVMGYNPNLYFRIGNSMAVHGGFMGSYYNNVPEVKNSSSTSTTYNGVVAGDYVPFQYLNGGATLYLWSEYIEGDAKVNLPSESRNGTKQNYFLEIKDVEKIRQFGFRATAGTYQGQIAEKGLEFEGVDPDPNVIFASLENTAGTNYSSIEYSLFSAGFSYEGINHLKVYIETDSMGYRSKKNHWRIYTDFLVAQNIQLGDMLYTWDDNGTEMSQVYELQKYTIPAIENDVLPYLGYRVGFDFTRTSRVGYSYGIEVGARPGTGNFLARSYASAKVGLSLNWRLINY